MPRVDDCRSICGSSNLPLVGGARPPFLPLRLKWLIQACHCRSAELSRCSRCDRGTTTIHGRLSEPRAGHTCDVARQTGARRSGITLWFEAGLVSVRRTDFRRDYAAQSSIRNRSRVRSKWCCRAAIPTCFLSVAPVLFIVRAPAQGISGSDQDRIARRLYCRSEPIGMAMASQGFFGM